MLQSIGQFRQFTASQSQPSTSSREMPVLQSIGLVSQIISNHNPTSKKVLSSTSVSGAASDFEQQMCPMEGEGGFPDQEAVILKPDQQLF